ncbi:helix-turn-helix domain-containing protein [Algoriphagus hitonicola]|uniref:Helix-turn-helix n=1 Tax=Algoriphagus hitonicola TaxID=435880 RepID=A0A1I2W3C5_9BACT|nr:Helix-turn-helix [Algoriphagus hitonicola]
MELGSRLKKIREEKKLSQQEVAHLLEVSQKTLSNIESGKTIPNILQIAKFASIYNLDMVKFLEKENILLTKSPPILKKQSNHLTLRLTKLN